MMRSVENNSVEKTIAKIAVAGRYTRLPSGKLIDTDGFFWKDFIHRWIEYMIDEDEPQSLSSPQVLNDFLSRHDWLFRFDAHRIFSFGKNTPLGQYLSPDGVTRVKVIPRVAR